MNEPFLRAEGLTRIYRMGEEKIPAVNGVSLTISPGDFWAVMGPSGSGKTTLLNLLGLLDRPDGGSLFIDGEDTAQLSEREREHLRLHRIGFIFQTFNLVPTLSALENVSLPMAMAGVPLRKAEGRARELLSWVGLSHRLRHRPGELSAGERQRVGIARSLANRPTLILGDEPTGNLDSRSAGEICSLLRRVHQEYGTAIVLVTHNPEVAACARSRLRMRDGEIEREESGDRPAQH